MSILDRVTKGPQIKPMIHTIFGVQGCGKSTWASKFPKCLFLDLEKGSYHLDVARLDQLSSLSEVKEVLESIQKNAGGYKTLVIDSVESLESMIFEHVCAEGKVDSIEKYDGGYGKGYVRSREIMSGIMKTLRAITESQGLTVILIGHSQVKNHTDPAENVAYDRYIMRCNDKMSAVIRDLSDSVFFCAHKVATYKDGQKTRAISDGERVMYTSWRAAYDAKSRLNLPHELPLDYQAFISAIDNQKPKSVDELKADITQMAAGLDQETKTKALDAMNKATTTEALIAIKNRISTIVTA